MAGPLVEALVLGAEARVLDAHEGQSLWRGHTRAGTCNRSDPIRKRDASAGLERRPPVGEEFEVEPVLLVPIDREEYPEARQA